MLTFIDKKQLITKEHNKEDNFTTTTMNILKELKMMNIIIYSLIIKSLKLAQNKIFKNLFAFM